MQITPRLAAYLTAVIQATTVEGRTDIPLTTTCPECGDVVDAFGESEHGGEYHVSIPLTGDTHAVVVGCEGYWVVNPNLVGIDSPDWSDGGALGDEVTGVHSDPRLEANGIDRY